VAAALCYNAKSVAEEKHSRRYLVSGRVQGVGFRMFVLHEAQKLGVSGFVRNLQDGRVEAYACGTTEQLAQLKVALQRGPWLSKVSAVQEEEAPLDLRNKSEFVVERDERE
jgi:acylphosphatase